MINSKKAMNVRNIKIKKAYKKLKSLRLVGEKFGLHSTTIGDIVKK